MGSHRVSTVDPEVKTVLWDPSTSEIESRKIMGAVDFRTYTHGAAHQLDFYKQRILAPQRDWMLEAETEYFWPPLGEELAYSKQLLLVKREVWRVRTTEDEI